MRRPHLQPIKWTEPLCFSRRDAARELRRFCLAFVRWTLYGVIGVVILNVIIVALNVRLPHPIWIMYVTIPLAIPALLLFRIGLGCCLPCTCQVSRRGVVYARLGQPGFISHERIIGWRFALVGGDRRHAILRIRCRGRGDRVHRLTIGLGPRVALPALDRRLRLMQRLVRRRTVSAGAGR